MSAILKSTLNNRILQILQDDVFERISRQLEPVDLPNRFMLAKASQSIRHVYFLNSGIGSIVAESPEGQRAEAGLFGREGWAPVELVMGSESSTHDIFMQVGGEGHRIDRALFLELVETYPALRRVLTLFAQTLSAQTSFTALSNAVHNVEERLARWLLMCHDRVDGDEIALTHEFLSIMLAVRRPSVTSALHVLEGNRFIRAERGYITIRDRAALEEFAVDTYGRPEEEYRRLVGPLGKTTRLKVE